MSGIESSAFDRVMARIAVGAYDDAQDVRTSMMNRVRDIIRKKNEGIPFDAVEEEKEEDDYDSKYKDDNLAEIVEEMVEDDLLTEREHEYLGQMLEAARMGEKIENQYQNVMEIVKREPVYTEWLDYVYGISTVLTARLVHKFGYCEDFPKVSHIWSYSGLAPGQEPVRGEKLGYDPDAKTLAWLVSDRIIMQGDRSLYKHEFYDPYKEKQITRLERDKEELCIKCGENPQAGTFTANHWECNECGEEGYGDRSAIRHQEIMSEQNQSGHSPTFGVDAETIEVDVCSVCAERVLEQGGNFPNAPNTRGHADTRARRYLAKKVLKHYWAITRDMQGYSIPDEWILTHGGHDKEEDSFENPFYAKREVKSANR